VPDAGRGVVERCPLACEGSADGALRVERLKGGGRGLQGDLGDAGSGQEGSVSFQGGGDAEAEASESQGKGELSYDRVRQEVFVRRVVHQEKGGKEHLSFGGGDVGAEPPPRRGAGEVGEAGLEEERSWRNLSCVGRRGDVSDVTRLSTAAAQELASASTKASAPREVLAATSPSRWCAMPRAAAVAVPTSADRVCAAHLGREGDRPISAVAATR
jgi:hypothetical protein